jgi:hypothetical protein
VLKTAEKADQ